jgi:hypothetical protein
MAATEENLPSRRRGERQAESRSQRHEYGCAYEGQDEPMIGSLALVQGWVDFANSHGRPAMLVRREITTGPWESGDKA